MSEQTDTANASTACPGYCEIKARGTTQISFWSWNLKIAYRPSHESGTRLVFTNGMWLPTTASVSDVMVAVGAAQQIYTAIERQDQAVGERVFDSESRIGSRDTAGQIPNSGFTTDVF